MNSDKPCILLPELEERPSTPYSELTYKPNFKLHFGLTED
jgi:hypothetical protein